MKRRFFVTIVSLAFAVSALASWYDDYNEGVKAVNTGHWQVVIQKMTAAIAGNAKENDNARTYGNIFINYHPYYYRGLAYLRTGKYDLAVSDLEKTSGPGEIDRGSIDNLMQEAKMKQAAGSTTATEAPPPPAMDPELRQRANAAISAAEASITGARNRNAASAPQYQQAVTALIDAKQRVTTAKTNDDLRAGLASADTAKTYADLAMPPVIPPPPPSGTTGTTATTATVITTTTNKPFSATGDVLRDTATRVRHALENYFNGEFDTASAQFASLSREMPKNGWIWAFLGASQYSQYAFEADESYKSKAIQSFRKAKQYRTWKNGLPQKYFSRRIRKVFESAS